MSDPAVLLGPLLFEQGLRLSIAALLLPVGAHRVAPVMPDHGGGAEPERPATLLQAPADVDIVAGDAVAGIKPSDRLQRLLAEGHIAARNMLRLAVRQQDMSRTSWRIGDTVGEGTITGRGNVGAAHSHVL